MGNVDSLSTETRTKLAGVIAESTSQLEYKVAEVKDEKAELKRLIDTGTARSVLIGQARKIASIEKDVRMLSGHVMNSRGLDGAIVAAVATRDRHEAMSNVNIIMSKISRDVEAMQDTVREYGSNVEIMQTLNEMTADTTLSAEEVDDDPGLTAVAEAALKVAELENAIDVIQRIDALAATLGGHVWNAEQRLRRVD